MPINLTQLDIDHALPRIEKGLGQYLWLQREVRDRAKFHESADFRRRFNHYYRVRRDTNWQRSFYSLLARARRESMTFDAILDDLLVTTGRFESSFASKLYATVEPTAPVIDSIVLKHLGLKLPYAHTPDRFAAICRLHSEMSTLFEDFLRTPAAAYLVLRFSQAFPEAADAITAQKKLDFVLWQYRPRSVLVDAEHPWRI
jgi:hypothetical protein